jgi:hypothetical protein
MSDIDKLPRARNAIRAMPTEYADLGRLVAASSGTGLREKVSTSRTWAPLVVNEDIADLRAAIVTSLHRWACDVADAASFDRLATRTPVMTSSFILAGWRWIEAAQWADDMADAVLALSKRIDDVTTPPERHKVADRIHDGLIDGRDVASALSVSPSLVRQWVASGELTPRERGPNGRNLYNLDDIRTLKIRRDMAHQVADGDIAA